MDDTALHTLLAGAVALALLAGAAAGAGARVAHTAPPAVAPAEPHSVHLSAASPAARTSTNGTSAGENASATITTDLDRKLAATADQTIRGRTNLPSGTNVTVRIRSQTHPVFLKTTDAAVGEDGSFAASFDLSDVTDGNATRAEITVVGPDVHTLAESEGTIYPAGETPTAKVVDTSTDTPTATPASPTTTDTTLPGFGPAVGVVALLAAALVAARRP